jgi:hypothetical protein
MVYKKYIKRDGKLYGPYLYHSRRVGGKVISEYRGTKRKIDYKKFIFIFFGVMFFAGLVYGVVSNRTRITGRVVDLDAQNPQISNLTITQLHEGDGLPHKYELNLGVLSSSNTTINYTWGIDCGDFYINNESLGIQYSGYDKLVEWHTTGECADAIVKISATGTAINQELVQSIFNPEDRIITDINLISASENITEENNIIEKDEIRTDTEDTIDSEIIPETINVIEETLPLTENEKQILIDEFGNETVKSEVKLFEDRIIVRYEFGEMWIKNSYDADLPKGELEEQMEDDRIKWLRDIIRSISEEETLEEELKDFEESYTI